MRIESKFLTADVRFRTLSWGKGRIVAEGRVKEMMPVRVEMGLEDLVDLARALAAPLLGRLEAVLPPFLRQPAG